MSWNYRLIHRISKMKIKGEIFKEDVINVHEVYYDDDGNIKSISVEPIRIGFTLEEGQTVEKDTNLHIDDFIIKLLEASTKPVLKYEELMKMWGRTIKEFDFDSGELKQVNQ